MGAIYVKRLILSVALIIPIASNASDALNQPSSSLNDGVETFFISCFDMPQETTTDMDACQRVAGKTFLNRVMDSVAALNRLKQDNKDDPQRLQELTASFNAESEAWTELIEKASKSVQVDYAGGTIAGTAVASRQIGLLELQSHDIWEHWLRFEDSTPPLLPEPKFKSE